jgi:hypothetical protein
MLGHLDPKRTKHLQQHLPAVITPDFFPANPMPQSETMILCIKEEEEV